MLELNRDVTIGKCYLLRGLTTVLTLRGSSDWTAPPVLQFTDLPEPLEATILADIATWSIAAADTETILGQESRSPFRVLLGDSVLVAGEAERRSGWVGLVEPLPIEVAGGAVPIGPAGPQGAPGPVGYLGVKTVAGAAYTVEAGDVGWLIRYTSADAVTVTLPAAVGSPGQTIDHAQRGAGSLAFVAGAGAQPLIVADTAVTRKLGSMATTIKEAADTWAVVGDLA